MNKNRLWKTILVIVVVILAIIYALPNWFGEDPAIQISAQQGKTLTPQIVTEVNQTIQQAGIKSKAESRSGNTLLVRFKSEDDQAKAKKLVQGELGSDYIVALNLASASPSWLKALGARPMKLGLDLRGGIHFLLQVDVASVIKHRVQGEMRNIGDSLREQRIRYAGLAITPSNHVTLEFRSSDALNKAYGYLTSNYADFVWKKVTVKRGYGLDGELNATTLSSIRQNVMQQAIMTLRRRVNELGVSEPMVQQQGMSRIAVDLPGVQDAARAQDIIGKTATLEFHLVDTKHDVQNALEGVVPLGSELLYTRESKRPVLLQSKIILKGSAITSASASIGQNGRPQVSVRLGGGGGEAEFERATANNVGQPMAVVYVETQSKLNTVKGKTKITYKKVRDVINVATIQQALGNSFQITNLSSLQEASNLALLLRAGSLPTTVTIIEEQTVGPSLGKANIHMGLMSVISGLIIIVVFMILYYSFFGIIADIGLVINLVFTIAVMSLLGAVLTLPGIAAMILAVGMAVDANVLINERIREELRSGLSISASINAGYDRALSTIIDSNVTTLIAAVVLMSIGTGSVKGFAVTLTIGILTSMFTAITVTRSLVNFIYGRKKPKTVSIGISMKRIKAMQAAKREAKNG